MSDFGQGSFYLVLEASVESYSRDRHTEVFTSVGEMKIVKNVSLMSPIR